MPPIAAALAVEHHQSRPLGDRLEGGCSDHEATRPAAKRCDCQAGGGDGGREDPLIADPEAGLAQAPAIGGGRAAGIVGEEGDLLARLKQGGERRD